VGLLDLLFPPRCGGCGRYGAAWCGSCAASVRPIPPGALADPLDRAILAAGLSLPALSFVPLHPHRLRERGFNQAERLAAQLARRLGVPLLSGLTRVRATPAQVGLSQAERHVNLEGAFRWTAAQAPPAGLGLVDDVCTTGATVAAAA
jgi:competence protein ComFC